MAYIETRIYKILGRHLRNSREAAGLTLTDVAEKLSITPMTIQRYEKGDRKISVEKIRVLCDLYNIDADQLMQSSIDSSTTTMKRYTTAERLKEIMNSRNLRQVDILSLALPYCEEYGVKMNKSDLSQYVSGKVEPNQDKLAILGMALGVNETWLMGFNVPMGRFYEKMDVCTSSSPEAYSTTSDIVALLQSESEEIQRDALALMECFVSCDTYSKGRLLAYAQGLNHSSIDNDYEEIRQEVIKAREERKRKGREQLEDCAPVKESV